MLVTADNVARAEPDRYVGSIVASGGVRVFEHPRAPAVTDAQSVVRVYRVARSSAAVFDLDTTTGWTRANDLATKHAGDRVVSAVFAADRARTGPLGERDRATVLAARACVSAANVVHS
jgi:hypothetical protein